MSTRYPFKEIEKKWQDRWLSDNDHKTDLSSSKDKFYHLTMFSYPSGDRLHIGHWYNYGPADTYARYMKMKGYNVFQPQGFDAFGLPAENYAIENKTHPAESTQKNIETMKNQLMSIGAMYDWSQEVNTSSEDYYKWTQWLFLQLYNNGLAYQKTAPVNWCPSCATVLANEQVNDGSCERCKSDVTKKDLKQWFFKITEYAEELLTMLDPLDWPEKTKHMQRNWIGRSEGASIVFSVENLDKSIEVFTTRPDTIYGATYMVIAPEHPYADEITIEKYKSNVQRYIDQTRKKTEIERTSVADEKTGVFTGSYAINPISAERIPIWIADYVIVSYGTGAIMAVPGGDERDFMFAKKYKLPIREIVSPDGNIHGDGNCFPEYGYVVNSSAIDGLKSEEASSKIIKMLEDSNAGSSKIQYKLHDWLISRQRYWGTPIPIIHCADCGAVPIEENELPLRLPSDISLSSTYGEDMSPLATHKKFINTTCPECSSDAQRDPDTMDTFVCSSWYYLRYPNAHYSDGPFDPETLNWLPVDCYIGGSEHATMHLLYARFITKALRDFGFLSFDEPFLKLYHQGTITKDGTKMSKSKGNTVSPDRFIDEYGSDTFRAYLMFMGPFDEGGDWSDSGITGIDRFINKVWAIAKAAVSDQTIADNDLHLLHKTIKAVSDDMSKMKFNTCISRLMELVNHIGGRDSYQIEITKTMALLLAPLCPHISEEIWSILGNDSSIFSQPWPEYDPKYLQSSTVEIAVQVNGKLRGRITIENNATEQSVIDMAKMDDNVRKFLSGNIIKEIVIPNKIVNFVVKQ